LLELFNNNAFDDSAYKSDSSQQPQHRPKRYLQFLQEMIDRFIVRGSYSPMQ
jgi:hypothetical protein